MSDDQATAPDSTAAAPDPNASIPPEQHPVLLDEVGKLVTESGGVSGLAQQFEQKGLGGLMAGWISSGPNPPIGGEQVLQLLGRDRILAVAAKAGLSEAQVTAGISAILPKVINELTPNGTAPNHTPDELSGALGLLKSKFLGA
jgi:uncharacterized protein YidB (DUF937 family)